MRAGILLISALVLPLTAYADQDPRIPGDENFISENASSAENGSDFSYARLRGAGRAYDGTDTSVFFQAPADAEPAQAPEQTARTDYITRKTAPAAVTEAPRVSLLRGRLSD